MSEADFWKAVRENDVRTVGDLLSQTPDLTNARIKGEAWVPGHVWDHKIRGQAPAPEDFPFSNAALHTAAVNEGRADLAKVLLQHGADVNDIGFEPNKGLTPPLVLTAWEGDTDTLRVLLDFGADPNLPASSETALYTAIEHTAPDKIELLLERGARHDVFTAAMIGDVDLVRRMIRAMPALLRARSHKRGRTPAEEAAHYNRDDVVRFLQNEGDG